ncbi:chorismate pyruvate-lyase family protein [Micromonospora sp. NPDC023644]|uniref:chorismate--pyruvate lyase family protein n=1 Tax=Micromonospora sp. NPDC023644 TaxID=3154321 RepID=UPI0033FB49E1
MTTKPLVGGPTAAEERLHRMVVASDGSTTSLLESYLDEPLRVEVLPQRPARAGEAAAWPEQPLTPELLVRYSTLVGAHTGTVAAYARCLIAVDRLPAAARADISRGDELIGRALRAHRVEQHREILAEGRGRPPATLTGPEHPDLPWRTVLIVVGGAPAMLITEWFRLSGPDTTDG